MSFSNLRLGQPTGVVLLSLAAVLTGCKHDPQVEKQKYFESGLRFENSGKLNEAAIQFSNAIKIDKGFAAAHYELSKTYAKLGTPMAAYQELLQAVDLAPQNVEARLRLGSMQIAGGAPDLAAAQAKAVLAMAPNNADAYALLSAVASSKNDAAGALSSIQKALQLDPGRASFHTSLGVIENANPSTRSAAESELQKAVSLDPKNVGARTVLAGLYESRGELQNATEQMQQVIAGSPNDVNARARLAGFYLRAGDKAKAEHVLYEAADQMPDSQKTADLLLSFYATVKDQGRAEQAFHELAAKHTSSVPLRLNEARLLLARGDTGRANAIVEELKKNHSEQPDVMILSATLLAQSGRGAEALKLAQKAVRNAPLNAEAQLMLARLAEQNGDITTADAAFKQAYALQPDNVFAATGVAHGAMRRNDLNLLAQMGESTIVSRPGYSEGYLWRGLAATSNHQFERAESDLQTSLKLNNENALNYLALGQLRMQQQRQVDAAKYFEQALDRSPNLMAALTPLVSADLAAKNPTKAVARVQAQLAKVQNDSFLYSYLAALQYQLKDFQNARDNSKRAIDLNAANQTGVQVYAQAEAALGNADKAIGTWQQWLTAHPQDAAANTLLGTLEEGKGDASRAAIYYKKALDLDPGQALASNNLAYLMVEQGQNLDVALTLAQAARQKLPDSSNTADTLAWVYYHKGAYASARDLLEDAVKNSPENAYVQLHLGMTYSKLNERANAEAHLKKAAALAPNSGVSKKAEQALGQLG